LEQPQLTAIVSAGGGPGAVEATLRSLAGGAGVATQVLVLCWTPEDAAAAVALGAAVLELPVGVGQSAARNQVAGVLETPWLAFLQAGLCLEPGWAAAALGLLKEPSPYAAVGGRLMDGLGRLQHAGFQGVSWKADERPFEPRYAGEAAQGPSLRLRRYQSLSEHCLIVGRDDFLAVGGFHPALSPPYAGHDLCFKLRGQRGLALAYQPDCVGRWSEGACPPPEPAVRMVEHKIFYERWRAQLFPDFAIWDAVDASEARTGRAVADYEKLL
jgi:hypothetical protein